MKEIIMNKFIYLVTVEISDNQNLNNVENLADQVMNERLDFDEDYGFDYTIEWEKY